jgi:hypothetical protein
MSHDGSGHDSCLGSVDILWLHFEALSVARGVTDPGVGSGALLGLFGLTIRSSAAADAVIGMPATASQK